MTTAAKTPFQPRIDKDLCKQCGICIHFCPRGVLEADEKGFPLVQNPKKCNGCLMCFLRCPDFSLEVINDEER